ncbi:MerR family transcriptional regulator [Neobacillus cucumis]|uniref:MerR family transcriptional regulator n=1 Tax=Neobacillus cucumis TaxID=1740721 RepID=UPI00203BCCCC|nr:MerR family transcriptional regulator [Neobacillus cucumis]MCM3724140.1 MerR family transcriptional regulator [Neobacillus cucumis]
MKTYTLKEVSKKINVSPGTLRKWEQDFEDLLDIPRTKQGARKYTDLEIELLLEIKQMADKKVSKEAIRQEIQKIEDPKDVEIPAMQEDFTEILPEEAMPSEPGVSLDITLEKSSAPDHELPLEPGPEEGITPVPIEELAMKNTDLFFEAMETYKKTFLSEVKDEIRSVMRKEVLDEVRKEITKGTYVTVKSISDSIYKSSENTKAEIQQLSESVDKISEETTDSLKQLSNKMTYASLETSEEIFSLSKQLSETSEELSHYVDVTNNEVSNLAEAITKDREILIEERNQYRNEVTQRELAFQQMLTNFRDVAATKEKRWWKFWT